MLVATRDPMPQHGRHDAAAAPHGAHAPAGSRMSRFMFVLQLVGAMLAIPVGLASGYSMYRANFSPETACQRLRNDIIAMIDKQIDASTRRMLVRKDVETFEKTCGAVDPDAEAAFKSLLAAGSPPVLKPAADALDPMPAHEWRKADAPEKPAKEGKVKEAREQRDLERLAARAEARGPSSDARWLDAVRSALTAHEAERAAQQATVKPLAPPSGAAAVEIPPIQIAPTLPPPSNIGAAPAVAPHAADHPVPPAAIPDAPPEPATTGTVRRQTSWLDRWPGIGR